jgi:tellurite resistance protein TehA-like permease
MGLATIINGLVIFGRGKPAVWIAHGLWWLDVIMSVTCGLLVPFLMFTRQEHSIEKMTGVWLLPIVAPEVAAVSGALLVPQLPPSEAFTVLILCYALWAFSVQVAMSILVILLLRLALHKLPEKDMAASGWLALGPIGTGALGLGRKLPVWFAFDDRRPLVFFAGLWTRWTSVRKVKEGKTTNDIFAILTPNPTRRLAPLIQRPCRSS